MSHSLEVLNILKIFNKDFKETTDSFPITINIIRESITIKQELGKKIFFL